MLLLFQSGTSYNPEYEKVPIRCYTSPREVLLAMHNSLFNKYSYAQYYYYTNNLNMILTREGRPSIVHIYDSELYEQREYLTKFHVKEVKMKLKKLIGFHQNSINAPRYFLEPISLDLIVDKNYTKKRKLRKKYILEKQAMQYSTNRFNLTNQFIKKKLLKYEPILNDLNESKPTTFQFVDMMKDFNPKFQKSLQFMVEMEQHHKVTQNEETTKINQFNQIVQSNKNSNMSGSTKLSTTRIQKEPNIRQILSTHYQNNQIQPNQRIVDQQQILQPKVNQPNCQPPQQQVKKPQLKIGKPPQIKIDVMESIKVKEPWSTRVAQETQVIRSRPFYSPKAAIKPNINFRKVYSNLLKLR